MSDEADSAGGDLAEPAEPMDLDARVPNPEGTDIGCLLFVLIGGAAVCAIPFGGVALLLFGWVWIIGGKNERAEALRHRLDDETVVPVGAASVGDRVTLLGKVRGPAAVTTPLGHPAVVAALWLDDELADDIEGANPTWTKVLGDRLELDADGGRVVIAGVPLALLSEKKKTTDQAQGRPPAHAPLTPEERKAITKGCEQYGERWLEPEMEVLATGLVGDVDEIPPDQGSGYRSTGLIRQITLVPLPDAGAVRVSTYSPRRVAQLARQGKAQIVGSVILMAMGIASLVWWSRFFGA